jgi:hypothetical protein
VCRDAIAGLLAGDGADQHFSCWPAHNMAPGQPPAVTAPALLA